MLKKKLIYKEDKTRTERMDEGQGELVSEESKRTRGRQLNNRTNFTTKKNANASTKLKKKESNSKSSGNSNFLVNKQFGKVYLINQI